MADTPESSRVPQHSISASEVVSMTTETTPVRSKRTRGRKGVFKATGCRNSPSTTGSIPSKYQTFFTSSSEPGGFNSCSTRFSCEQGTTNDNPGPGTYNTEISSQWNIESLSKRGTGGLASRTKRFPRCSADLLGPGSYNPSIAPLQVDFNRAPFSRNFHPLIIQKSQDSAPAEGPAPNTYNISYSDSCKPSGAAVFRSKSKRIGALTKQINSPGPGHYNPKQSLLYPSACCQKANFLSKTNRGKALQEKEGPGPADYTLVSTVKAPHPIPYYRQKHYLCISAPAIPLPPPDPSPGPGHYEVLTGDHNTQLVTGAVFKSTSSRWSKSLDSSIPGPGAYEPKLMGRQSFLYNTNHHWV